MLSNEQNDEECDATGDAMNTSTSLSTEVGLIKNYLPVFIPICIIISLPFYNLQQSTKQSAIQQPLSHSNERKEKVPDGRT